jgi:hypothetical protein
MLDVFFLMFSELYSTAVHTVVKGVQGCALLLTTPPSGGKHKNLYAPSMKQIDMMLLSLCRGRGGPSYVP